MGPSGRALVAWSPQERGASASSRKDRGIYAAAYDPDLLPAVTQIAPNPRRFAIEVTETGRATVVLERRVGTRFRRVSVARARVVPGYNPLRLRASDRRKLSRRGTYRARARVTDFAGKRSKTLSRTFRVKR